MTISNTSRGLRPGVCLSTNRPANPFDGQVIYETDTDLVKAFNGTDFVTVGPAPAAGLVVVKAESALSGSSTTADNVFTSAFTNYRVVIRFQTSSNQEMAMQFRAATVDTATGYNFQRFTAEASSTNAVRSTSQAQAFIGQDPGAFISLTTLEISGPQLSSQTLYQAFCLRNASGFTAPQVVQYFGNQSAATAFDGIKFLTASGNLTGTFTIYGYAKTL